MRQKQTAQPDKGFLATAQPFPASGRWKWRKNNRMLKWLRGKGGVRSDFLRETTWRLGQKFPLWHMTHAALTPFPAWGTPPNRLDWPCPRSLRTQQPASCSAQNVWPARSRLAPKCCGFWNAATLPGAHSPSCSFHIRPKGDQ